MWRSTKSIYMYAVHSEWDGNWGGIYQHIYHIPYKISVRLMSNCVFVDITLNTSSLKLLSVKDVDQRKEGKAFQFTFKLGLVYLRDSILLRTLFGHGGFGLKRVQIYLFFFLVLIFFIFLSTLLEGSSKRIQSPLPWQNT